MTKEKYVDMKSKNVDTRKISFQNSGQYYAAVTASAPLVRLWNRAPRDLGPLMLDDKALARR